jgi:hypothetical protein
LRECKCHALEDFKNLPNARIWGDRVYFTVPGRKSRDRSCTLTLAPERVGGFIVKDHHAEPWHWKDLKDFVRHLWD